MRARYCFLLGGVRRSSATTSRRSCRIVARSRRPRPAPPLRRPHRRAGRAHASPPAVGLGVSSRRCTFGLGFVIWKISRKMPGASMDRGLTTTSGWSIGPWMANVMPDRPSHFGPGDDRPEDRDLAQRGIEPLQRHVGPAQIHAPHLEVDLAADRGAEQRARAGRTAPSRTARSRPRTARACGRTRRPGARPGAAWRAALAGRLPSSAPLNTSETTGSPRMRKSSTHSVPVFSAGPLPSRFTSSRTRPPWMLG